jgi:hypothetical protein
LAHVILNLTERAAAYTTKPGKAYEAAELEEETRDYCDLSMSEALEAWFPAAALTPGKQLIVAFGLAAGEQWAGRREIEKPPAKLTVEPRTPRSSSVPAATTATPPTISKPPTDAPDLTLVPSGVA